MTIQVDSREKAHAITRILEDFSAAGVKYYVSKLYIGDYMSLDNPRVVIDRKQNLDELCGNVCQQHERFRAELLRAQEAGIQIIILCEHGPDITSLQDVYFWQNPRKHEVKWKTVNGHKIKTVESSKAVDGEQLYKSLITMRDKYGVRFEFCTKDITGQRIKELLE